MKVPYCHRGSQSNQKINTVAELLTFEFQNFKTTCENLLARTLSSSERQILTLKKDIKTKDMSTTKLLTTASVNKHDCSRVEPKFFKR